MSAAAKVTPLEIFEWAVVRQSSIGPGLSVCARSFGIPKEEVRRLISEWNDPRGHLELQVDTLNRRRGRGYRIEAYYNTSGG